MLQIFAFLLLSTSVLQGIERNPLIELDTLILSTEDLVIKQKTLRKNVNEYILLNEAYLQHMDNKELLLKTANLAKQILDVIKNEKLSQLFEPTFISELTLFAKLSKGPSIPPIP